MSLPVPINDRVQRPSLTSNLLILHKFLRKQNFFCNNYSYIPRLYDYSYILCVIIIRVSKNVNSIWYIIFRSRHELVDSEPQWREAQKRKGEGVQKAIVSIPIEIILFCNIWLSTNMLQVSHTEPRRRHRSRHRSPSQKQSLPDELRKYTYIY